MGEKLLRRRSRQQVTHAWARSLSMCSFVCLSPKCIHKTAILSKRSNLEMISI